MIQLTRFLVSEKSITEDSSAQYNQNPFELVTYKLEDNLQDVNL